MLSTLKSLVAKSWKDEDAELEPGKHFFDEEFVVRISGSVEQRPDELVAPTVRIPLIPALVGPARESPAVWVRKWPSDTTWGEVGAE